ncbi:MAG: YjbQ family protein [Proteobacteria bacterium]|nr:YjbQ family protein [Pseudomonadota bacterium]
MLYKLVKQTKERLEMVDITAEVSAVITECEMTSGVVSLFVPHTSAGLTMSENTDREVQNDIMETLSRLAPYGLHDYGHRGDNSDSHIKSTLLGCSHSIIVEEAKMLLGSWQSIYLCELDGPRDRTIFMKILTD